MVTTAWTLLPQSSSRVLVLFLVGAGFALVQRLLLAQRVELQQTIVSVRGGGLVHVLVEGFAWWIAAVVGAAAALVGVLCPHVDRSLGHPPCPREWADVLRGVALFAGANHASARIDFPSSLQLTLTLLALGAGLWWLCDRSRSGLGLGVGLALLAMIFVQVLAAAGIMRWGEKDSTFLRAWLPFVCFSGGVTAGNIGRQLLADSAWEVDDKDDEVVAKPLTASASSECKRHCD